MRSPFRSEGEAFHYVLLSIAASGAIALASLLGGAWAGVPVWAVLTVATVLFYLRPGRRERTVRTAPPRVGPADERRILVVATEVPEGSRLAYEIERAGAGRRKQVHVVCPTLTSHLRHWTSDTDGAAAEAQQRLDESISRLRAAGIEARGEVGDEDPIQAIEDALREFGADEIIFATHPDGRVNWHERGVVDRARERFALPIAHVVAGSEAAARA